MVLLTSGLALELVLLDRDGVINEDLPTSVRTVDDFRLLPRVGEAISLLNQAKIPVVVVTNQATVGRGETSLETLKAIHHHMNGLLKTHHASLDRLYYCTDTTVAPHFRRKPAPGMLEEALRDFHVSPSRALLIGDSLRDLEAAAAVGCHRALVRTGKGRKTEEEGWPEHIGPVWVYEDLFSAVTQYG